MDRRSTIRYSLQLPVRFKWKDKHGKSCEGLGRTRDISTQGSFVIADTCPPQGTKVEMKLELPLVPNAFRALQVHVEGQVDRLTQAQENSQSTGFAVRNRKFILREAEGMSSNGADFGNDSYE